MICHISASSASALRGGGRGCGDAGLRADEGERAPDVRPPARLDVLRRVLLPRLKLPQPPVVIQQPDRSQGEASVGRGGKPGDASGDVEAGRMSTLTPALVSELEKTGQSCEVISTDSNAFFQADTGGKICLQCGEQPR